ncbi:MAG: PspA/IM30 family protein [Deltaproteobacteria bacterium]|nr:PspA/IM30 family protein [Deltaproteobacteria bacterium]
MGILGRINDIIRSNLNLLISKAENPEKLLRQAILDMEDHLRKARKQVMGTLAAEKQLEKRRESVQRDAQRWEKRAELALEAGDEDLARQALARKGELDQRAEGMEERIRIQREYVGALKQSLASLEERLREARARKDALVERARSAAERRKNAELLDPLEETSPIKEAGGPAGTLERMEDRVRELESKVEAYAEMADPGQLDEPDPALDAHFSSLEQSQEVEGQLEALKERLAKKD